LSDGSLGGFCNSTITCKYDNIGCDVNIGRCVHCEHGYHNIHGYCIEGKPRIVIYWELLISKTNKFDDIL